MKLRHTVWSWSSKGSSGSVTGFICIGGTEADGDRLEGPHEVGVDRLHVDRADESHRDHGDAAFARQPGHPGATLVHELVERPGPFGVEAEQATVGQHVTGRVQARSDWLPPPRRIGIWPAARKNQAVFQLSKYSALAR